MFDGLQMMSSAAAKWLEFELRGRVSIFHPPRILLKL
jgi:hypothetical protein